MSKGNVFMGYGRGKVGSIVLARSKGQQVARAYNDSPKNPRSRKQTMQRSVFMAATKFYSRGTKAFFKFAFEGKKITSSDYNAFMASNAKVGLNHSKAAYDESTYPSIAPFMMTKGSLTEMPLALNSAKTAFELTATGLTTSATIGGLSDALINTYGLQGGDIITLCIIVANGSNAENTPAVEPDKRGQVVWTLKQFILDVASTATISSVLGSDVAAAAGALTITPSQMATSACGACVTVSRETTEGLKVCNTYLTLNEIGEDIYEAGKEQAYIDAVMASWKSTGEAILQGSLA